MQDPTLSDFLNIKYFCLKCMKCLFLSFLILQYQSYTSSIIENIFNVRTKNTYVLTNNTTINFLANNITLFFVKTIITIFCIILNYYFYKKTSNQLKYIASTLTLIDQMTT